jgi:hypothetical protein
MTPSAASQLHLRVARLIGKGVNAPGLMKAGFVPSF